MLKASLVLSILGFPHLAFTQDSPKLNVCTISITSEQTANTFKKKLGTTDFNHVELTTFHKKGLTQGSEWFAQACQSGIQCDVLMIAGHFAGTFFADSTVRDAELSLTEMEEQSCSNSCDGILKRPREVFLMGCNTLAPKYNEMRPREEVVQTYVDDGFTRQEAERRAAILFSPMGAAYKDRMRRVFKGAGNLYGFNAASPASARIQPYLEKYFSQIPNYKEHLMKKMAEQVIGQAHSANSILQKQMIGAFTQCQGILPSDPDYEISQKLCTLYDERQSLKDRLLVAQDLLKGPERVASLPSLFRFMKKIAKLPADRFSIEEKTILQQLKSDSELKNEVLGLRDTLSDTPEIQLELNTFAQNNGWLTENEATSFFAAKVKDWAKHPEEFKTYLACSNRYDFPGFQLQASDFTDGRVNDIHGVEMASCFSSRDPQLAKSAFQVIQGQTDYPASQKLYQMAKLTNDDPEILNWISQEYQRLPSSDRFSTMNALSKLRTQHPGIQALMSREVTSGSSQTLEALNWMGLSGAKDEKTLQVLLQTAQSEGPKATVAMSALRNLKFEESAQQIQVVRALRNIRPELRKNYSTVLQAMDLKPVAAGILANYAVSPELDSDLRALLLGALNRNPPLPDVVIYNLRRVKPSDPIYPRVQTLLTTQKN